MRVLIWAAAAIWLALSVATVHATDVTAAVESAVQACLETIRDINSDPNTIIPVSERECVRSYVNGCLETDDGQTTIGMASCMMDEMAWWDRDLNNSYQLLKLDVSQEKFTKLRDVQRKWIAFKEAACKLDYEWWGTGSIRTVAAAECQLELTATRAIKLSGYVNQP